MPISAPRSSTVDVDPTPRWPINLGPSEVGEMAYLPHTRDPFPVVPALEI